MQISVKNAGQGSWLRITGAGAQSTNNNNIYGSSDPGTASFDGPGQRNGIGQHAGSRDSQMTAAYSNVRKIPANNHGNESRLPMEMLLRSGNGYSNRGSGPYASDPGNDPYGPQIYGGSRTAPPVRGENSPYDDMGTAHFNSIDGSYVRTISPRVIPVRSPVLRFRRYPTVLIFLRADLAKMEGLEIRMAVFPS